MRSEQSLSLSLSSCAAAAGLSSYEGCCWLRINSAQGRQLNDDERQQRRDSSHSTTLFFTSPLELLSSLIICFKLCPCDGCRRTHTSHRRHHSQDERVRDGLLCCVIAVLQQCACTSHVVSAASLVDTAVSQPKPNRWQAAEAMDKRTRSRHRSLYHPHCWRTGSTPHKSNFHATQASIQPSHHLPRNCHSSLSQPSTLHGNSTCSHAHP